MSQWLYLFLTFITNGVDNMVREVHFAIRYFASLTAGASVLLFVSHMTATDENIHTKAHPWDNAIQRKFWTSMVDSSQVLPIDIGTRHVD